MCLWVMAAWQDLCIIGSKGVKGNGLYYGSVGVLLPSESFFKSIQEEESLGRRVLYPPEMLCSYRKTLEHKQI